MINAVIHVRNFEPGRKVENFPKRFLSTRNLLSPERVYLTGKDDRSSRCLSLNSKVNEKKINKSIAYPHTIKEKVDKMILKEVLNEKLN
ncbi:MAG: hypothetical protein NT166_04080 [Candidatus Aminicenantes bacterium]|nr:hypothetical protein [Candidatus Aminicenantes bacterium]